MPDWKETLNPATLVEEGRKLVASAGTRETLGSAVTRQVVVQGLELNTGHVVIGGPSVEAATGTRKGILVTASGPPVSLAVDNLSKVYVDSRVAAEGVSFTYLR
jgi:hypothetical protein